ncbi:MAG: RIP metalloprotease RseP [Gammaproteobacteria bacterium]|nr:MAG: RIP metalloprotease RseP [Gammaproteobacteria bacterium]
MLIAVAGPAVNLLFAVLTLWLLFIIGVPDFKPTIGTVNSDSVLARAQIGEGDNIVAINGSGVDTLSDANLYLVDALGSAAVPLVAVDKNGRQKTAMLDLSNYQAGHEMAVNRLVGFNWALAKAYDNQPLSAVRVISGAAAEKAGLKSGDLIVKINESLPTTVADFVHLIQASPQQPIALTVSRQGQTLPITLIPQLSADNPLQGYAGLSIGQQRDEAALAEYQTTKRYGWLMALPKSISANYLQGELMLKTLWRLVVGKASVDNLGGPITIADYSGKTLEAGYVFYFQFLAAISLVLAVMNLLPLPVLDGGHIAMCLLEMVRGKPLSERALDILMRLGGSVVLTFMLFVVTLDIWRYLFK